MARLYEQIFFIPETTENEWLVVPFPSRSYIDRIRIATKDAASLEIYNRLVEPPAVNIQDMFLAEGNLVIRPVAPVLQYVRQGDIVTVAGNSNALNNSGVGVEHIVEYVTDDGREIHLYSEDGGAGTGGTMTVDLTDFQKELYKLVDTTVVGGFAEVTIESPIPFVNQDTERATRKWIENNLHVLVTATSGDWLQIVIAGSTDDV
jgi:hypothetical protein